jgi:hypothetical protein
MVCLFVVLDATFEGSWSVVIGAVIKETVQAVCQTR